jgi:hypothetical protein
MSRIAASRGRVRGFLPALGALVVLSCLASPALSSTRGDPNAITFLVGRGTDTDFTDIITEPWTTDFVDLTLLGVTASTRLGTVNELFGGSGAFGDDVTVDAEAGAAYRFGFEDEGEFWGSLYLRYDGFPWNDWIYTTAAINTGWSILTDTSEFERHRSDGQSSLVLHYFAPEITFADPDNKDVELVIRLHHRSGIFGLVDDVSGGSTFITTGIRVRF